MPLAGAEMLVAWIGVSQMAAGGCRPHMPSLRSHIQKFLGVHGQSRAEQPRENTHFTQWLRFVRVICMLIEPIAPGNTIYVRDPVRADRIGAIDSAVLEGKEGIGSRTIITLVNQVALRARL